MTQYVKGILVITNWHTFISLNASEHSPLKTKTAKPIVKQNGKMSKKHTKHMWHHKGKRTLTPIHYNGWKRFFTCYLYVKTLLKLVKFFWQSINLKMKPFQQHEWPVTFFFTILFLPPCTTRYFFFGIHFNALYFLLFFPHNPF